VHIYSVVYSYSSQPQSEICFVCGNLYVPTVFFLSDTTLDGYTAAHPTVRLHRLWETFFDAPRRLSGTYFLRLSSEVTRCLFSNLG